MPRILWLRSNDRFEEVQALELETGLKIAVSNGEPASRRAIMHRAQVILVELPIAASVIQEILQEAQNAVSPLPVIIYDPECVLDEALVRPQSTVFRHVTERYTAEQLGTIVALAIQQAGQLMSDSGSGREPWQELLIGESRPMSDLHAMIRLVSPRQSTVLITGETGTGKEMVARAIHMASKRAGGRMVAVNCAAIPETLIESEIFGHERGAFTGALERRAGCFELAEEGTLLLDEIGEMPVGTQAKLLRVLEDRKLRRLGSKIESPVDVRVLAATNKDPETAVADGHLRGDLYYRLNVFNIHMPPLREHKEDIPAIVDSMLRDMNEKHSRQVAGIGDEMLGRLIAHDWPGNVRELRNTIERAVILCGEGYLDSRHLPPGFGSKPMKLSFEPDANAIQVEVGTTVDEAERRLIIKTLESTNNNKTKAAEILGISLKTLHNKLKEYGSSNSSTDAIEE